MCCYHLPVFRASRKGQGRSAPVHGRGTLRTSPRKKIAREGDIYIYIYPWTLQLLDQIGPMGRFGDKLITVKQKQKLSLFLDKFTNFRNIDIQNTGI